MKLQVLAAAVEQDVRALAESMNLSTDAIIVNQCGSCSYEEFEYKGRQIRCGHHAGSGPLDRLPLFPGC